MSTPRYWDVDRIYSEPVRLTGLTLSVGYTPPYHKSARLEALRENFERIQVHLFSGRLNGNVLGFGVSPSFQRTARLVQIVDGFEHTPRIERTARLVQTQSGYNFTPLFQRSARTRIVQLAVGNLPVFERSGRLVKLVVAGDWTTGSVIDPTPYFQRSARINNIGLGWEIDSTTWERSARYTSSVLSWLTPPLVWVVSGRLTKQVLSWLHPITVYQRSSRLESGETAWLRTVSYLRSGRLLVAQASWNPVNINWQRSARLSGLLHLIGPNVTIRQEWTGRLQQFLHKYFIQTLPPDTIPPPKDPMGTPQYYWLGWPSSTARGTDNSRRLTFSLYEIPETTGHTIELWYYRMPVQQGITGQDDALERPVEIDSSGLQEVQPVLDMIDKVVPELAQYMTVLQDYLLYRYYAEIKENRAKSAEHLLLYRDARGEIRETDVSFRQTAQHVNLQPLRL